MKIVFRHKDSLHPCSNQESYVLDASGTVYLKSWDEYESHPRIISVKGVLIEKPDVEAVLEL